MSTTVRRGAVRRVRGVRLVGVDDPDYREFCGHYASLYHASPRRRSRPPYPQAASSQVAPVFEEIVRRRLGRLSVLRPERILAFEIQEWYGYRPQYLEIDAVSGSIGAELRLFEIKATHERRRAMRGWKQLRRAGDIAGTCGGRVSLVDIWVDTNPQAIPEGPRGRTSEFTELESLEALARWNHRHGSSAFVRIPGSDAWSWAAEEGLDVDDDLWRRAEQEIRAARERRQSLKEAGGVPPDERPVATSVFEPRRPSVYVAGPAKAPETALSAALRRAFQQADSAGPQGHPRRVGDVTTAPAWKESRR